jgi:DNA topoisomerase IA
MKLLIVESKGKIPKITSELRSFGIYDINIIATKGRLFDLPEDELAVDTSTFAIKNRVAISQSTVDYIRAKANECKELYIGSDNDSEGHVIAQDIYNLVQDKRKVKRAIIENLSGKSIIEAINNAKEFDLSLSTPGIAKRIFDRIIGYEFSRKGGDAGTMQGCIGRVLIPALNIINKSEFTIAEVAKEIVSESGGKWMLKASVSNKGDQNVEGLAYEIEQLGEIEVIEDSSEHNTADSLTGPSSIIAIASALNRPVKEINDTMQRMYENGLLSYIRTDSSLLSDQSASDFCGLIYDKEGVVVCKEGLKTGSLDLNNKEKERYQEGSHGGLVPMNLNCSIEASFNDIELEDQILILLSKRALKVSGNIKTITKTGRVLNNDLSNAILRIEIDYGTKITVQQTVLVNGQRETIINNDFNCQGLETSNGFYGATKYRRLPKDLIVAKLMNDNGLGRPSTLVYHADRIANRALSPSFTLNYFGEASLTRARTFIPLLLNLDKSIQVERSLSENNGMNISDRILSANSILEIGLSNTSEDSNLFSKDLKPTKAPSHNNMSMI